jgi:hypothetical protein
MRLPLGKRQRDSRRAVVTADWVFVATLLVLGAVTGLVTVRHTRLPELAAALKVPAPPTSPPLPLK